MSVESLLLALRLAGSALLLTFVGVAFALLWRDIRTASREHAVQGHHSRRQGKLIVVQADAAPKPGTVFPLLPLTSLGRAPTNTICIEDSFASGEHALITLRDGQWWLEDRGSSNGTLLNGYRIEEPVVLSAGDVIGLGQAAFRLELE
jgi:hypothetical protein